MREKRLRRKSAYLSAFAGSREERIPRYAYLPFGGGPRVCIGNAFAMMEARLILAMVAGRYRLTLEPDQRVEPMQVITVKPRGPVRMRVKQRAEVDRDRSLPYRST